MPLPADLPRREAGEAVRRIALDWLDGVREALDRLQAGEDPEALHDARVAVRRLRSFLRAFRQTVKDDLPRKVTRDLRRAARATNEGRDAEVLAALLASWLEAGDGPQPGGAPFAGSTRRAAARLQRSLERRRDEQYEKGVAEARRDLERLLPQLRRLLSAYRAPVDLGAAAVPGPHPIAFGALAAAKLRRQAERLAAQLAEVRSLDDLEAAHRARIEGKRLRYLLEPLRDSVPAAKRVVAELRRLQDRLGELHDLSVLETVIEDTMIDAAKARARRVAEAVRQAGLSSAAARAARSGSAAAGLPGLLAETRRRLAHQFTALDEQWSGAPAAGFFADLDRLARELEAADRSGSGGA